MPHSLIGKLAPTFSLPDFDGIEYSYDPAKLGKPSIIFFYLGAGNYGCTKEACNFRDAIAEEPFRKDKVLIFGVSGDSAEKQDTFVTKNKLNYPILSDHEGKVHQLYHVKKPILRLAAPRVTFIVDSDGFIRDSHDSTLSTGSHVNFAMKWLKKLEAETSRSGPPTTTEFAQTVPSAAGLAQPTPGARLADL